MEKVDSRQRQTCESDAFPKVGSSSIHCRRRDDGDGLHAW
jgi:hypothetical protein